MQKLIFTFLVALNVVACHAQDSTYIEMDYTGNQDKPVHSIFIYPENMKPRKLQPAIEWTYIYGDTYAVTPHHYGAIISLIDSYSLNHPMDDTGTYPISFYNIYIHSTDNRRVFLKTIVSTRDEAQVFFGQLLSLFDKYQPSKELRSYLNHYVFYGFR